MSKLDTRIRRLEDTNGAADITVMVLVPMSWDDEKREEAFDRIVLESGIVVPFQRWIQSDSTATEASLGFAGNLGDLLAEIGAERRTTGQAGK
jgi:hypothetical protein